MVETLNTLLKKYNGDIPVAVYRSDGNLDFIGQSGTVFLSKDDEGPVLVFAGN